MLETLVKHLSMVRLSIGAAVVVMMVGCTGLIDAPPGSGSPKEALALDLWTNKAFPVLKTACLSCHNESMMMGAPGFLVGSGDATAIRTNLLGFKDDVVNIQAPKSSQLLTKGLHNGPQLEAQQASDLLDWIKAEADLAADQGTEDTGTTLDIFSPLICTGGNANDIAGCTSTPADPTHCCPVNHLSLKDLGLPGAELSFVWEKLDDGSSYIRQLTAMAADAPSTDGLYMEHPLFLSWPADALKGTIQPTADSLDRFLDVKLNLDTGSSLLDGGAAAFIGFVPTDKLSIHFKKLDKHQMDAATTMTPMCKQLASFKANAAPQFATNCASCHAGTSNPSAHSGMNLDGVNTTDDAMLLTACNELRLFSGLQDPNNSAVFVEPNPASGVAHPFKFPNAGAFTTFQTAVQVWVMAEKTSP